MRRYMWLSLGLVVALGAAPETPPPSVNSYGTGTAYDTLGHLAVLHQGRVKPLDTMARQLIKEFYGSETITLYDSECQPIAKWEHVGALLDMTARPDFWDDQKIIRVEFLPLKRVLLAEPIKKELTAIAGKNSTGADDRAKLQALAKASDVSAEQLTELVRSKQLPKEDGKALLALATRLGASKETKWFSPHELENTRVTVDGRTVPFELWLGDIARRVESEGGSMAQRPKLPDLEKNAYEAGVALRHYQAIRGDRVMMGEPPNLFIPRPSNATYLRFSGEVQKKITESAHDSGQFGMPRLTAVEEDAARVLGKYLGDIQGKDRRVPGTDKEFDARYSAWLREKAVWVPLRVVLESDPQELEKAGFPSREVAAFRDAYQALAEAEAASPGQVSEKKTAATVAAARDLGEKLESYPKPAEMARETHFNAFAPFYKASMGYGLGLVLLVLCVGISAEKRTSIGRLAQVLRVAGMAGFLAGIFLEIYGFYLRVRISGWAPVTNMYETVIWVALVVAVIGLALELIYRRIYPALAASGVAFLGTTLAYKVPLLDPNIKSLTPVLRSNYWLTIHVLTEVSSYAAFALAMGLGLIGTIMYLTATYRRSVSYRELSAPVVPGMSILGLGALLVAASSRGFGPAWFSSDWAYAFSWAVAGLGAGLLIVALAAVVGEAISRLLFRAEAGTPETAATASTDYEEDEATPLPTVGSSGSGGGVATLIRPTVAEIRAKVAAARPQLDARALAMQAVAAKLKPLSNYVYRAIQVGVLLIAAGTFLGGLWADVSWGRFWGWDPKEVWALITLLVYLIPLHGRFAGWINTFGLVAASVVCFLSVVMAWYGVNFVLGVGLHSYGFTEGGGQGIVVATCAAVLAVVAAAGWRRSLAQRGASTSA